MYSLSIYDSVLVSVYDQNKNNDKLGVKFATILQGALVKKGKVSCE